jgi:membrane-bound ClpP family serine protease
MEPWIWALILLALGLALTVLEIFLPSGGLIAFLSACSLLAAVVMAFRQGSSMGIAVLGGGLVGVVVVVVLGLQLWPKTSMGKRMLLEVPEARDILPDTKRQRYLKGLIGRIGEAKTKMLPNGAVSIDGRTIDAVSEGMFVEAGQRVRVIEARANRVVVRPITDEVVSEDATDPLARPIDTVVPDPFGEPPPA